MEGETTNQQLVILFGAANKGDLKKAVGYLESLKPQYVSGSALPVIFSVRGDGGQLFTKLASCRADFIAVEIGLDSPLAEGVYSAGNISTALYGLASGTVTPSGFGNVEHPAPERDYAEELKLSIHMEDYERAAICRDIIANNKEGQELSSYDKKKKSQ